LDILTTTGSRSVEAQRLYDIGPRGFKNGTAVATLSFTPLSDREAYVTKVKITAPSAADTWNVTVGGRTIATFRVDTVGNQQLTGLVTSGVPKVWDIFEWHKHQYDCMLTYPVPWGQTLTVASVGAATADVEISFMEVQKGTTQKTDANHYEANYFRLPIWAVPPSATTTVGENTFASQISAPFVPSVFTNVQVQAGYVVDLLALWAEGAGRNTYSGSADHQSITNWVFAIINGQRYFTRDVPQGFPLVGTASATGSANTVYNSDLAAYPAFQQQQNELEGMLDHPILIGPGTTSNWGIDTSGSQTGGADYSHAYLVALADVVIQG